MPRRRIGQEELIFAAPRSTRFSSLDELTGLIDWAAVAERLDDINSAAKGEPAWPPLALFKALLIAVWYDLSDVKLAEALDDRASFRRFCGFSSNETTPERTAFVRFRKELVARDVDKGLFDAVTRQLKAKAVTVKTGHAGRRDRDCLCEPSGWRGRLGWSSASQGRSWLQGPELLWPFLR